MESIAGTSDPSNSVVPAMAKPVNEAGHMISNRYITLSAADMKAAVWEAQRVSAKPKMQAIAADMKARPILLATAHHACEGHCPVVLKTQRLRSPRGNAAAISASA